MPDLHRHIFRTGQPTTQALSDEDLNEPQAVRKKIEPWLSAIFQSEHLSLLVGSGLSSALSSAVGHDSVGMDAGRIRLPLEGSVWTDLVGNAEDLAQRIAAEAEWTARRARRGSANIEDLIRACLKVRNGLSVLGDFRAAAITESLDAQMSAFMHSILAQERSLTTALPQITLGEDFEAMAPLTAREMLTSFLLSFASRTASRDRLEVFTTNYDRFIEYGCDLGGLRIIDRFVGSVFPHFRSSRLNVDMHYDPPGIRGEPRYLEGVVHFTKLHGSLDWTWQGREVIRIPLPFGAPSDHPQMSQQPSESVMIYPNPAKDVETLEFPYAELFRDFAGAICRPNSALVTYGYGFGDDHVNRVIRDMLTIPSTHLVIIAWDQPEPGNPSASGNATRKRIIEFCRGAGGEAQISFLLGEHLGSLRNLVRWYLPKPAIDPISKRRTELLERRGLPTQRDDRTE